jgi:hypothetical protein
VRSLAALLVLVAGAALSLAADRPWLVRHFFLLDSYLPPSPTSLLLLRLVPLVTAAGLAAAVWKLRAPAAVRIGAAAFCALHVSELLLRHLETQRSEERRTLQARLGEPHPLYGWIFRPDSSPAVRAGGRTLKLAFDADGSRIAAPGAAPDPARPSLLFAGESIAMGHGLDWEETFAAVAARDLGLQAVNLAVNGYGIDQAWLRLTNLLPRYRDVRAVVMVVLPLMLGRNLIDDHPRLTERFEPLPPSGNRLRLRSLFVNQIPFRSEADIAKSARLTRALLLDVARRARTALFLVPSAGPDRPLEAHSEAQLLHELFDGSGLRWALVDLGDWERWDGHPNARGARKLAAAVESALRGEIASAR